MDYYEELGLACGATTEQIRSAYRGVARLLHPDQQQDEELRRLAEVQMRHLNFINDVLTDPVRRSQYDASLLPRSFVTDVAPARQPTWKLRLTGRDLGLLAAGAALGSLFWLLPRKPLNTVPAPDLARQAASQPVPPDPLSKPQESARGPAESSEARQRMAALRARQDAALAELTATGAPALEPAYAPPIRAVEPLSLPPPGALVVLPPPAAIASAPSEREPDFAGTWVYVRPRITPSQLSMYSAEYVEAVIVEQSGILRGRYRALYKVPDRPISSEVVFRFEGRHNPVTAEVSWTGAGGAKGDLKLRLISRDKVELSWIATDLGSQMGLASGSAILTRRQEP